MVKYFGCAYTQSGVPDLLCCVNGNFLALEVKAERGRPSALQLHSLKSIDKAGGIALLVYPKDYDALIELIDALSCGKDVLALYEPFKSRFL